MAQLLQAVEQAAQVVLVVAAVVFFLVLLAMEALHQLPHRVKVMLVVMAQERQLMPEVEVVAQKIHLL
jgi:hypothetical protein